MTPTPTKPLAGLRVLELARILAGPWAGQLLADLGADVIKVERPGRGDDTRQWGPPFLPGTEPADGASSYFEATNRGKRSVALDLADARDLAKIKALAIEADVLIENFKVGALARFGLDTAALRAVQPRLIYCSITGFGQTGPYAGRAGYDFLVQGMGGAMSLTGEPRGEPMKSAVAYADVFHRSLRVERHPRRLACTRAHASWLPHRLGIARHAGRGPRQPGAPLPCFRRGSAKARQRAFGDRTLPGLRCCRRSHHSRLRQRRTIPPLLRHRRASMVRRCSLRDQSGTSGRPSDPRAAYSRMPGDVGQNGAAHHTGGRESARRADQHLAGGVR